ncbi:MAG: cytochrome P450 [Sporichthyaceae bacterium]
MPSSLADLPGPRRLPLLGNAHQLRHDRLHLILEEWADRFGPIYRTDIGRTPLVVIADRDAANAMLRQRPEHYRRWSNMAQILDEVVGRGVFTAEGEDWRRQRRMAVTALNADRLHRYHGVVAETVLRLERRLDALAGREAVDLLPLFRSYTTEVVTALAFGHRPDLLGSGEDHLRSHIERVLARVGHRIRSPFPYWRWVKLPADRAMERSCEVLHAAIAEFVAQARRRRAENPGLDPDNFLDGILESPDFRSDAEIAANAMTMLLAGEDTTANSLGWAAWYAATRPDVAARLRAEADEVLGDDVVADAAAAGRLEYADAVVREAIRLHGPASFVGLEPLHDVEILGTTLPAGTRLALLVRHIGLQADPATRPGEFDPDRWLGDTIEAKGFLAFGAGQRVCPGRGLAYLEAKVALATIAHRFDLMPDRTVAPPSERFVFVTGPSAVRVRLRGRDRPVGAGTRNERQTR